MAEKSQTTIRLPKELYKSIQHIAIDLETSVNALVVSLVEKFVNQEDAEDLAIFDERMKESGAIPLEEALRKHGRVTA